MKSWKIEESISIQFEVTFCNSNDQILILNQEKRLDLYQEPSHHVDVAGVRGGEQGGDVALELPALDLYLVRRLLAHRDLHAPHTQHHRTHLVHIRRRRSGAAEALLHRPRVPSQRRLHQPLRRRRLVAARRRRPVTRHGPNPHCPAPQKGDDFVEEGVEKRTGSSPFSPWSGSSRWCSLTTHALREEEEAHTRCL